MNLKTQPKPFLNPVEAMFKQFTKAEKRAFMQTHRKQLMQLPKRMVNATDQLPEDMRVAVLGNWKSREFGCVIYPSSHPVVACRLSINRMALDPETGSFLPGISWDDLYRIKNEVGYRDFDAVEVFPAEDKLVNVSNMRHLWVLAERLDFGLNDTTPQVQQ